MAKRLKKSIEATGAEGSAAAPAGETRNGNEPAVADKAAGAKTSASHPSAPRKTTAGGKRKTAVRKKATPAEAAISDDEIRLRAYFIAERRMREGAAGDSEMDWLVARRQLLQEAADRA